MSTTGPAKMPKCCAGVITKSGSRLIAQRVRFDELLVTTPPPFVWSGLLEWRKWSELRRRRRLRRRGIRRIVRRLVVRVRKERREPIGAQNDLPGGAEALSEILGAGRAGGEKDCGRSCGNDEASKHGVLLGRWPLFRK